jgi:hypothetical protein
MNVRIGSVGCVWFAGVQEGARCRECCCFGEEKSKVPEKENKNQRLWAWDGALPRGSYHGTTSPEHESEDRDCTTKERQAGQLFQ